MILKCECESQFQDQAYGEGKRVFTTSPRSKVWKESNCTIQDYKCTVCKLTKTIYKRRDEVVLEELQDDFKM